jgi:nitrite reductase/ring-hydroxylating ferredoxin subunit
MDQPRHHSLTIAAASLPEESGSLCLAAAGWSVLICRSGGALFAVENRCTHLDMALQGGRIRRGAIFCPHHGARFLLSTGAVLGPPASEPLKTFPCRETQAGLVVDLPIPSAAR